MRKTKVICTLGPACENEDTLRALIRNGMDAARFNFSHGSHESHLALLTRLREIEREQGASVATILDTKGPEIRITELPEPVSLPEGGLFTLTTREITGNESIVSVTYKNLHDELIPGCRVLLDDGLVELRVEKIEGQDIHCEVINGGELSNNKSINIPDVHINLPSLTARDKADILFAIEHDFDFIAASFVRSETDVTDIREHLNACGGSELLIISKIENREGVANMDAIIKASDGIMVARGDLGVEVPAHEVPVIQKQLVMKCNALGKPVIIATQILDSMIRNPRATRAEISDVANSVFEIASCVMLSGETASGKYPIESLRAMADTLESAEKSMQYWQRFRSYNTTSDGTISGAIGHSCCVTAMDLGAKAILAATASGHTARVISRYNPACDIIAMTTTMRIRRQLSLYWGVKAYLTEPATSTDGLFDTCIDVAKAAGLVEKGDTVIITAGIPIGIPVGTHGRTNLIKAQVVE